MGCAWDGAEVACWELVRRIGVDDICWSGRLCIGQDGHLMLEEGQGLCMWSSVSFVVEQVFSGPFEEATRWCACALMETGYCLLVHVRLCRI